ncbi:MAG: 6-phosphofructokinase [Ruminococcaceae bacterium]|nr:6-phosphofructokinase [Oscillospiraceae bacterium]
MGNAIVGQSGGPTAAINATLAGVIKGAFDNDCIETIYGAFNGIEGILAERICNLNEIVKSEEDITKLAHTPAAALGSCRLKLPKKEDPKYEETFEKLFDIFKKYNIRYFFYIGGNDSMDTVAKLSAYAASNAYEMSIMGVPKTIDNDVMGTSHTPGYGSAAKYIATSMQEIIRDCGVYTVKAVTIVEIMGRDAGWLTAAAALPRKICGVAPDLIYLPERDFSYDEFFEDVAKALEKHPNVVVAVSEGLRCADGTYVGEGTQSGAVDVFGHKYLSGTGKALEIAVKEKLGCKVRSVELNILQRCASHIASKTDIEESLMVGHAAVDTAANGVSGKMMCFARTEPYSCKAVYEDIEKIANKVRHVPDEFINERGNNVTDECVDYILPLINGEVYPEYKDGLPVHFVIER